MGIVNTLKRIFKTMGKNSTSVYNVRVRCNRCGEVILARVNLYNDLSIEYGEEETDVCYVCRKILIGENRCFQQVEVILKFDRNRILIDRSITGGQFLDN